MAQHRLRNRIAHLVDEVHWKAIDFLLKTFDVIIIPPFETVRMSRRTDRKISSKTVRKMTTWSHYTFRTRLQHVAAQRGKVVAVKGEEYTSKTCTACGWMNDRLGGAKVFSCKSCNVKTDRDVAGARNILLKNIESVLSAL